MLYAGAVVLSALLSKENSTQHLGGQGVVIRLHVEAAEASTGLSNGQLLAQLQDSLPGSSHSVAENEPSPDQSSVNSYDPVTTSYKAHSSIRQHLKQWQEDRERASARTSLKRIPKIGGGFGTIENSVTQSGEDDLDVPAEADEDDAKWDNGSDVDFEGFLDDIRPPETFVARGDMIELRIRDETVPAVCTQWVNNLVQVYTVRGQVVHKPPTQITFSVPGMITPEELDPILPFLPREIVELDQQGKFHTVDPFVPREAGGPLINRMLQLNNLADELYRSHIHQCDHIWELALEDGYVPRVSLQDIALKVFQCKEPADITTPMLWCLHRVIDGNDNLKKNGRHHRLAPKYTVLSRGQVENSQEIQHWVRDYQEGLASDTMAGFDDDPMTADPTSKSKIIHRFVRKARTLIRSSRQVRDARPNGCLGPYKLEAYETSSSQPFKIKKSRIMFDKQEGRILRCVFEWVISDIVSPINNSIGPSVLRATGMYDGFELDKATGLLFLKETRLLLPWENRALYMHSITSPLPGYSLDAEADKMHQLAVSSTPTLKDSMAGLRKDWGDLEVFCIDSMETSERDDGISWEAIDESTGWAHIHVANPSAFIDPQSITAKYAANLSQTLYYPECYLPMLQSASIREHCNLAPNSPVITFSARLRIDGDILETKISHGIVRNVKIITYDDIAKLLFPDDPVREATVMRAVGGEVPKKSNASHSISWKQSEIGILRTLREMGFARRLKRVKGTDLSARLNETFAVTPLVYFGEHSSSRGLSMPETRIAYGDPIISLPIKPFNTRGQDVLPPSTELVADFMLLAGEIASSWCAKRGIPIVFSGTNSNPHLNTARQRFLDGVYHPTIAEHGYCPPHVFMRRAEYIGFATQSAEPREHAFLNLPYYAKISSPLRRYTDLFSHWQIDAALRHEAQTGKSLVSNTDDAFLPFSLAQAKEAISDMNIRAIESSHLEKHTNRHWVIQWFNRAYHHKQAPLPEKLHIYIIKINYHQSFAQAMIMELGIQSIVQSYEILRAEGGLREGDIWEAEVDVVDCYRLIIQMKPIRLVEKSPFEFQSWMVPTEA